MNIPKELKLNPNPGAWRGGRFHALAGSGTILIALPLMLSLVVTSAANITLLTSDAAGVSSFTGSTNWSDGNPPTVGNAYFTGANTLRTTNYAENGGSVALAFGGDSLSIDAGGRLSGKIGNNGTAGSASTGTMTANYILNGGQIDEGGGPRGNDILVIAGTLTVNAASVLSAAGGANNSNANFETLEVVAPISGSAALQVCGNNVLGSGTGTVKLSAANPYSGTVTVPTLSAIANAAGRTLQINNVSALANATLNLTAQNVNPVSFTSDANAAPFNLGALTGTASQALSDTAGNAVALSVGGNNASGSYSGPLTGNGGVTKVGAGTWTLSGTNTYTGNTVISNGVLALSGGGSIASANIVVKGGAAFDVSSNAFTVAAGQNLLGSGTIKGPVSVASGASVYAGLDGTYGTNTFTTNLVFSSGASANLDLGAAYNGSNDRIVVAGNLLTTNTVFHIKAPGTSAALDQTADYILMTVTGSLAGTLNSTPIWDVAPSNADHYSIAKSGNAIVLHYSESLQPSGYGSVSPNPALRNQGVQITVTVTYSSTPVSSVTVDATALGGSNSVPLIFAGGGNYTNTVVVGAAVAAGDQTLMATITDSTTPTHLYSTTPAFTVTVNAAAKIWSGAGTDNNWSSNPNWQDGAAPGYVGDALTFAGANRLAPDMNANYSVTGVTFDGTAGSFVLGSSGGYTLTLNGDITDNSSTMQTLNLAITNTGNTIHVYGNNNLTMGGGLAGAGGLEDDVSGTLTLSGTNSFTGGINLNSGVLRISGAGMLGGTNGIYAGNITNSALLQYSSSATQTLSGVVSWYGNVLKDGPGTLILSGNNTYFADTFISNGVLQVTGTLANDEGNDYAYEITDNGTLQWSGSAVQILSGTISGDGGLIMDGSGTLNINAGNDTYSGATIANGGTLAYNPNTIYYSTPVSALVINGGGSVLVNADTGNSLPVGNLTLNTNGVLKLAYNFSGGNPAIPAVAVSGLLSAPGTNVIQINGYGAANTQFPIISYGTLSASMSHFVLRLPAGMSGNLVNNTATHTIDLNVAGTSPSTWIPLTADDPGNDSSFTNNARWQDGNPPTAGQGYYTQGYTLRSPADANDYTFGGSALSIDQFSDLNNSGGHLILKGGGGVITVTNLILNGGLADYANSRGDNNSKTLAGSITLNAGTTSYSGAATAEALNITAPISGAGNLQIGGVNVNTGHETGGVVLSGTNTYTGNTTVATGVLVVNGPTPNTSVTVLTNATLRGTDSIGGSVTVQAGGTLAAGIAAGGTLPTSLPTTLGGLTINGGVSVSGTVLLRLNRTNSPGSDRLTASSITINPGATLTVNNIGSTNLVAGDTFTLFSTGVTGFSATNLPALPNANLAWTNRLAVDGTIAVYSTMVGPSGPEALTNSFNAASGVLSLSWPANKGWRLQRQANPLSTGLGTNWVYVTDGTLASTNINVNATDSSVFYRLTYP